MSIATELTLLANSKQAIKNSINQKGGNITDSTPLADYSTAIDNLPSGGSGNPVLESIDVSDFSGTTFNDAKTYITDVNIPNTVTTISDSAFQSFTGITSITFPNSTTSLGLYAFKGCTGLTSINFGGVTSVGQEAFADCTNLTSVTIGSNVTTLGGSVFLRCTGLTSVTIPNTVTTLGSGLFNSCTNLASVTLPSNITTLPTTCFSNCSSLTSVTIPNTVTTIGNNTFNGCTGLTNITIPSGVTSIGFGTFNNCTSLTSITCLATTPPTLGNSAFASTNNCPIYVPAESVDAYKAANNWSSYASRIQGLMMKFTPSGGGAVIVAGGNDAYISRADVPSDILNGTGALEICEGVYATQYDNSTGTFNQCTGITSVTLPDSLVEIQNHSFRQCTNLASVTFGNSLNFIGVSGFIKTAVTSIELPDSLESIDNYAFEDCTELETVTIGNSEGSGIQSIGNEAFAIDTSGLTGSLTTVTIWATTPPTLGNDVLLNQNGLAHIYVPVGSIDTYKAASGWSTYASRIYPIQQVATVDGNPVYNYDLGMTSTSSINDTQLAKIPSGTSIEFAEGITEISAGTLGWANVTLPSTFASFGDQGQIGSTVSTITCWATTPPSAERNQIGGSSLTAIYVPAASVDTYKAAGGWSTYASRIQAIPAPSITEYEGREVIDNAVDFGDFPGCVDDDVAVDSFVAASANSTFDSDLKAANIIVVEDDNGNDITSQCTFTSPDFSKWDSTQDPSWDGERPVDYLWQAGDTIASGDSQTPGSVSITATYGALTDTVYLEYSKTDMGCEEPEPEPEPDPEEEPEEE